MKLTVQVVVEPDAGEAGEVTTVDVASIERDELSVATLGLCLDEAKGLLTGVQEVMVTEQAAPSPGGDRGVFVRAATPPQRLALDRVPHPVRDRAGAEPALVAMPV